MLSKEGLSFCFFHLFILYDSLFDSLHSFMYKEGQSYQSSQWIIDKDFIWNFHLYYIFAGFVAHRALRAK